MKQKIRFIDLQSDMPTDISKPVYSQQFSEYAEKYSFIVDPSHTSTSTIEPVA